MTESHQSNERDLRGSPDRFGYEWSTYSDILPEYQGQLERWLGPTTLESFRGKSVLDVGCGMGRNPFWYLKSGAARVLALDVDDGSLAAARKNLAPFENARVEKCSAYDLDPNVQGKFDRITCIGVLHHLADPEMAIAKMWSCVAPGGDLILWCYGKEGNRLLLPIIGSLRAIGSRVPVGVSHGIAKAVALAAWPVFKLAPFRTDYYRRLRSLSFSNVELIILDQILPHIAHYWSREDMEALAKPLAGGKAQIEFVQGNSWSMRVARE